MSEHKSFPYISSEDAKRQAEVAEGNQKQHETQELLATQAASLDYLSQQLSRLQIAASGSLTGVELLRENRTPGISSGRSASPDKVATEVVQIIGGWEIGSRYFTGDNIFSHPLGEFVLTTDGRIFDIWNGNIETRNGIKIVKAVVEYNIVKEGVFSQKVMPSGPPFATDSGRFISDLRSQVLRGNPIPCMVGTREPSKRVVPGEKMPESIGGLLSMPELLEVNIQALLNKG